MDNFDNFMWILSFYPIFYTYLTVNVTYPKYHKYKNETVIFRFFLKKKQFYCIINEYACAYFLIFIERIINYERNTDRTMG